MKFASNPSAAKDNVLRYSAWNAYQIQGSSTISVLTSAALPSSYSEFPIFSSNFTVPIIPPAATTPSLQWRILMSTTGFASSFLKKSATWSRCSSSTNAWRDTNWNSTQAPMKKCYSQNVLAADKLASHAHSAEYVIRFTVSFAECLPVQRTAAPLATLTLFNGSLI